MDSSAVTTGLFIIHSPFYRPTLLGMSIGKNTWIGESAWLMNLDQITIGDNVVISQRALLCTGSHDWSKESFDLITKPITVEDGVWICADVFIGLV